MKIQLKNKDKINLMGKLITMIDTNFSFSYNGNGGLIINLYYLNPSTDDRLSSNQIIHKDRMIELPSNKQLNVDKEWLNNNAYEKLEEEVFNLLTEQLGEEFEIVNE